MNYAYLHGFGSGPKSYKGTRLHEEFGRIGVDFLQPELNYPSREKMTYTGALTAMDALHDEHGGPWSFVASSMGGWLGARWAGLHPDRVDRLLLLCPGFDLVSRWPALLGEEEFARWERDGVYPFEGPNRSRVMLHWEFIEDARSHPTHPEFGCPAVTVHGVDDEVVPIEGSRRYVADRDHVRLVEVDDDHGLTQSVDLIRDLAFEFFDLAG